MHVNIHFYFPVLMFLVLQRLLDDFLGYRLLSVAKDLAQCVLFESDALVSITSLTLLV